MILNLANSRTDFDYRLMSNKFSAKKMKINCLVEKDFEKI